MGCLDEWHFLYISQDAIRGFERGGAFSRFNILRIGSNASLTWSMLNERTSELLNFLRDKQFIRCVDSRYLSNNGSR